MECIAYKSGYKYQLDKEYSVALDITPKEDIHMDYIEYTTDGVMTIKKGYAWDGPSGITFDTLNFMRGSLVHDVFYQLMRNNKLEREQYKEPADRLLQSMCKEDGMSSFRAWYVYKAVAIFGHDSTNGDNVKIIHKAPKGC